MEELFAGHERNVSAFVAGINAYIKSLNGQRTEEFRVAGFDPGLWTPEDVVSRLAGLQMTGNMMQEVNRAQQVARLGLSTVEMLSAARSTCAVRHSSWPGSGRYHERHPAGLSRL